jgi:tRNA nucleotidyltransferase (CCA-adding enzyme)
MIQIYKVGGCVRDAVLGIRSKDIDCAVEAPSFEAMEAWVAERGKIYLSKPEFFTIRAKVGKEDLDFVLCRKESCYSDGRRPDSVEMGTIYDDLARRDFTMNAIARREPDGAYIDPHGGIEDIGARIIRAVGKAEDRFNEDALRMLRAMRFAITLNFNLHVEIKMCFDRLYLLEKLRTVSIERQQIELQKCFRSSTPKTLDFLRHYDGMRNYLFDNSIMWLEPTLRAR